MHFDFTLMLALLISSYVASYSSYPDSVRICDMCSISQRRSVIGIVKGNGETETFFPKSFSLIMVTRWKAHKMPG